MCRLGRAVQRTLASSSGNVDSNVRRSESEKIYGSTTTNGALNDDLHTLRTIELPPSSTNTAARETLIDQPTTHWDNQQRIGRFVPLYMVELRMVRERLSALDTRSMNNLIHV